MLRRELTALLCAVAVMGLMIDGCSNSESAETVNEEASSEQQEAISEQQEANSEQPATLETAPDAPKPKEDQTNDAEDSGVTSQASSTSDAENEEITMEGEHQIMDDAPIIPLNTRVRWKAEIDDPRVGVYNEQDHQWYAFVTEPNSEDLVYQLAIGGAPTDFYLNIYNAHSDIVAFDRGHMSGANLIVNLEDLDSEAIYYIELSGVVGCDYYVKVSAVPAN